MAENQVSTPPMSRRDQFNERLKKKYPDREFVDDEALYSQIDDDYNDYENQINDYKERESRITDLFAKDPQSAQFMADMANGEDPFIKVIERLGIDGVTDLLNDPSKKEKYVEANAKYLERVAKSKELDELYEKNFAEFLGMLEQMKQERNLSDETIDAAYDLIKKITNDAVVGKITPETMDMALNAINHDADVANARAEGTVAGRNAKIDEKLRKPMEGDGTPNLSGSNNMPTRRDTKRSIFDDARDAM
ncbi:MAG: hypothetical protein II539_08055 [Muribaculaceae bacterium]|nr:hypothetical protein [Muribaculaceae bacterium]